MVVVVGGGGGGGGRRFTDARLRRRETRPLGCNDCAWRRRNREGVMMIAMIMIMIMIMIMMLLMTTMIAPVLPP